MGNINAEKIRRNLNKCIQEVYQSPILDALNEKSMKDNMLSILDSLVFFANLAFFGYESFCSQSVENISANWIAYANSALVLCFQFLIKYDVFSKIKKVKKTKFSIWIIDFKFKTFASLASKLGWMLIFFTICIFCMLFNKSNGNSLIHLLIICLLIISTLFFTIDKVIYYYFSVNNPTIKQTVKELFHLN